MTVTRTIASSRRPDRTKALTVVSPDEPPPPPPGRIPRISRLMALAIYLDGVLRRGEYQTQQQLANALHVTQARVTQLLNLNQLAPDLQEHLLFQPRTERGRDPITERDLRHIVALVDWKSQRAAFKRLTSN